MEVLKSVFNISGEGDRILITYPDLYSFLIVSKWIAENYGEPFWLLWTDAAVERINHLGKKYGFPESGDAITIATKKSCKYLNEIEKVYLSNDLSRVMGALPLSQRVIISFGINFFNIYGYDTNCAIEMLIEHKEGIMITSLLGSELVEGLTPFHDAVIEVSKSEDSYVSYYTYVANLKFSMKGGVAVLSDSFTIINHKDIV